MTPELRLQVIINPSLDRKCEGVVAFGDFEVADGVAYQTSTALFQDLLLGRALPLTFVTPAVRGVSCLVAVALFLHRELAIHPGAIGLVAAADMVDAAPIVGLAHIDRDLSRFFQVLRAYLPANLNRHEQRERLATAVGWIRNYLLEGTLPALPVAPPIPRVLNHGQNGFVVAETPGRSLEDGWVELWRMGFLRGVLFGGSVGERWRVLAARKSTHLVFDLPKAAAILNEAETAMGEPATWRTEGGLWLYHDEGTLLRMTHVVKVLLHV